MIKLKKLSIKNFMSVGNVAQSINLVDSDLVLVLGENLDLGGNDNRNGTGKSTILNALSYALYGNALTNIRKENLINKTNGKNMMVSLEMDVNGAIYQIERGRKPNVFKIIVNDKELSIDDTDESQGDSRTTQLELERTLGLSHTMFKNIIGLNTYSLPFLSMRASEQRDIIEQLLGITKLSEKAEQLKSLVRETKDEIKSEEFRIKAVQEANKQIENNVTMLERKSSAWVKAHKMAIEQYAGELEGLLEVDIDEEIENHKKNAEIEKSNSITEAVQRSLSQLGKDLKRYNSDYTKYQSELDTLAANTCPKCKQQITDGVHGEQISREVYDKLVATKTKIEESAAQISTIESNQDESEIKDLIDTFYDTIDEAYNHKNKIEQSKNNLTREYQQSNPYTEQLQSLKLSIKAVDYDGINNLTSKKDHQEFLLKLLTSKDSFIRKKIIDQNLLYLNKRLAHYIDKVGLPHVVEFLSNLEVEITEHGRALDFDNLSRGERTRLILSLSWAFRDVFESLNSKINLLFIDELIDSGLDTSGVEAALAVLKAMTRDQKRNIFLISHRDELVGRVDSVLRVVKEGGFTSMDIAEI